MIKQTIQHYINGAKSGKQNDMKPAFHDDATIFGYIGNDLFSGPIQKLYDWNDNNGPSSENCVNSRVLMWSNLLQRSVWNRRIGLDIILLIFLNCLKVDFNWKIINKVFHLHS